MSGYFKINKIYSFIFSLLMIFYLNPIAWGGGAIYALKIFSVLVVLTTVIWHEKILYLNFKSLLIFILSSLCIILLFCIYGKVSTINYTVIIFLLIVLLKKEIINNIFNNFVLLYSILVGVGLIIYIATFIIQIPSVYQEASAMKTEFGIGYNNYFNLLLIMKGDFFSNGFLFRFQSVFDEPGVIGTISGLILLAKIKDKINFTIFIIISSGLLSLSFAFVIFFSIWCILSFNRKVTLFFLILIVSISIIFYLVEANYFYEILKWIELRNNRMSSCFIRAFNNNFFNNIYFGLGDGSTALLNCDVSSVFSYLYDYGLVGSLLFFTPLFLYIVYMLLERAKVSTRDLFMLTLILFIACLNLYQRPDFFSLVYIILFLSIHKIKKELKQ